MFVESRGFRLSYEVEGVGAPVVLLHGFCGSGENWRGYIEALQGRFKLIAVDALGHGRSDKPHDPAAYTPSGRAADVAAVLDAEGIDAAHVWGYSMGGRNAYAFAGTFPGRTRSMIVGGAAPERAEDGTGPDYLAARADALGRGDWAAFFAIVQPGERGTEFTPRMEAIMRTNDPSALAAVSIGLMSWAVSDPAEIGVPAVHYAGEHDPFRPRVEAAARAMGAPFAVVAGHGHDAHRSVDQVLPIVTAHLDQLP